MARSKQYSSDYIPAAYVPVGSNAAELRAMADANEAFGAAISGIGTKFKTGLEDWVGAESAKVESYLEGLPNDESRRIALANLMDYEKQAETGGSQIGRFTNLEDVNEAVKEMQLRDFKEAERAEQEAQAASLLLTQAGTRTAQKARTTLEAETFKHKKLEDEIDNARSDADLARLWASDEFQKTKFAAEEKFRVKAHEFKIKEHKHQIMQDARTASDKAEEIARLDRIQTRLEEADEFTRTKYAAAEKDREVTREKNILALEKSQEEAKERERKRENAETVRQSLSVMEEVKRDFKDIPDGENTIRRQLETSISENKGFGITDLEQKALIDQYNKILADDRTIKITQDDLDAAFGKGNPPDYTAAGKLKLQDALFSRITTEEYVHATTAAAESKAKKIISKSKYAAKYANPLIAAFEKMEAASKPDPKTNEVNSKKVVSTYFNRRKYIADNWTDQLDEFDAEWKDTALNASDVTLTLPSLNKTKLVDPDDGTLILDKNDNQVYSKNFESIINKPNDQISTTDLKRYDKSIKQQLTKMGYKNLTPAEIAIVTANSEAKVEGLALKMKSLRALHAAQAEVTAGELEQTKAQSLIPSKVETEVSKTTQTLITTANHQRNAVVPTQEAYMEYLTKTGKDNDIEGTDLENAIRRLDDILISRAPTLKAGERAHILMNFLKAHSSVQTWTPTPDVVIDFDENGLIETASRMFGGDRQVIDIEGNAQTNKVFRMMMEKTGLYTYPNKAKKALALLYGNKAVDNTNLIEDNTKLLEQLSDSKIFGKVPLGVQARIKTLKDQIKRAEKENSFLKTYRKKHGAN